MKSLSLKLTLLVLALLLAGIGLVAIFARWTTTASFDRMLVQQLRNRFVEQALIDYEEQGSWEGVALRYQRPEQAGPSPAAPGPGQPPPRFVIVDQNNKVVIPAASYQLGDQVSDALVRQGEPIRFKGQRIGVVLDPGVRPTRSFIEEEYLQRTNQAIVLAGIGATIAALVVGLFLARSITRPLVELTDAARAMGRGHLKQEVPVRSRDELGELAAAFNDMSAAIDQANQQRRQMTADIAHDLRNPLMVMTGYIEAMRDGVLKPTDERFSMMHDEAQHLLHLVADLRTLSLADANALALNCSPIAPTTVLERTVQRFQHQAAQQDIALELNCEPDLPAIEVDAERMAQVLGNLTSNALRHTPSGGRVLLSAQRAEHSIQLIVQDSGEGIDPQALPHIFDRFYRADTSRTGDDGASGLGLTIARSIVIAHGGDLTAESRRGVGSRFTIDLPLNEPTLA